ncbi:tRNA-splicing endonuclease subunit Sen54 isoform X2 [Stegostoma tigrinum]|uniref:tRNA-splicing endonuclease subunit Sen54 isoform X2 n=1 Tax=Stegostoma tigrinum TaxID=3053191 RepID=UPI00286FD619|nr:tRNA-splicing endonuclease subunit Sen54 isoform X2 [Stegostoma tigrinum]
MEAAGLGAVSRSLSSEELFAARSRDHKIPQRTHGQKDFIPDHSEEQMERLRVCREEQWQLLSEERVERLGSLIKAEWKPQESIVELKSNAGKFWHTMGHVEHGKQLLYPEEALYLLECGSIQIYYRELPLSIQESYEILLSARTIPLEQYQVYSHLKRLGYVIMRFDPSSYERKLHLDSCHDDLEKHHRKRKQSHSQQGARSKKSHCDQPTQTETEGQQQGEFSQQDELSQQDATCKALEWDIAKAALEPQPQAKADKLEEIDSKSLGITRQQAELEQKGWSQCVLGSSVASSPGGSLVIRKPRWDFSRIKFPNVGRDCPQTKLTALDPTLLPPNIPGRASDETAWQQKINLKCEKLSRREQERMKRESRYKTDVNKDKRVRQCTNWKEYKELLRWKRARNKKLPAHLWKDKVQPLVKPGQVSSAGELQQHICILQSTHILDQTPWMHEASEKIKIAFDVYQADTVAEFRKTQPGKPFSRMCVCSFDGPVPDLRAMKKLAFQSGEVPVVFAVVDNGDISFYTFKEFKLPVDVYP